MAAATVMMGSSRNAYTSLFARLGAMAMLCTGPEVQTRSRYAEGRVCLRLSSGHCLYL